MMQSFSPTAILLLSTLLSTRNFGNGYSPSSTLSRTLATSRVTAGSPRVFGGAPLYSSATKKKATDDAFSAFADSLEEEPPVTVEKKTKGKPWQAKLEDLLDPTTNMADRQVLLSELMSSNEDIRESVMDALTKREIDPLLSPRGKKLQDGTRAVARQIANDILPQLAANRRPNNSNSRLPFPMPPVPPVSSLEKVGSRLFKTITNQMQTNFENLQEDIKDPLNRIPQRLTQQTEELVNEVQNVFLETPTGLQEPPYKVVESCEAYEIRDYEGYTVASTVIEGYLEEELDGSKSKEGGILGMGTAFNTLAAYLFGANQEKKSMAMTTPVTTTSKGEMRFYLSERGVIPQPLADETAGSDPTVQVLEIPPARLAVRKFTGFVTDGEVARQKDTLLQALEFDSVELDVAHGVVVPHVIFQYNPPYTLPMVRRNEIAIPVRGRVTEVVEPSLKKEWSVEEDDDETPPKMDRPEDDISPSD